MYRLTDAFPYLIARVGMRMGELFSRRLARRGITLPMYRVMAALWQRGGQRLGDLSDMTSVELSTLSRQIGVMQRKGLLTRTRPDSNARTVEINLTRAGRTLVEVLIPLAQRHEEVGLRGLTADQVEVLKANLATVYRNLDSLAAEIADEETRARKPSVRRGVGKASVRKGARARQRPSRPTRSADARHSDHGS
jgi:MarR family transcriptional regulator, organic hydroperoxide resistance regulator